MAEFSGCVALTGATGFVGRHILSSLLEANVRVRALVRNPRRLTIKDARVEVIDGNLGEVTSLARLVEGATAVVHVVGIIMESPKWGQTFQRVHFEGTRNLIEAARRASIQRWIHMSALGSRPDAVSDYHRSKWAAEQAVRESGLTNTIFRPSIIHGPDGEFMRMVKQFACRRLAGVLPWMPYFGSGLLGRGGAGRLQPVWVEDVARCFVASLTNTASNNEIYPMGGPDAYTWPQFFEICKRHLPRARPANRPKAVPVWYARLIAGKPGVPFNRDQVIMSQEDSVCQIAKVKSDFGFTLAPFEETFADYAAQIE